MLSWPRGTSCSEDQGIFISSNYIKPDERLEAKAAPVKEERIGSNTRALLTACWEKAQESRGFSIKGEKWKRWEGRHKGYS